MTANSPLLGYAFGWRRGEKVGMALRTAGMSVMGPLTRLDPDETELTHAQRHAPPAPPAAAVHQSAKDGKRGKRSTTSGKTKSKTVNHTHTPAAIHITRWNKNRRYTLLQIEDAVFGYMDMQVPTGRVARAVLR